MKRFSVIQSNDKLIEIFNTEIKELGNSFRFKVE